MPRDTRAATRAHTRSSALRAAEEPAKLDRAIRIVTAAAARGLLDPEAVEAACSAADLAPALPDAARAILAATGLRPDDPS